MAIIIIGDPAVNRISSLGIYTLIAKGNPANASGRITQVQIWANEDLVNCEVAIFTEGIPDTFTTRSNQAIGAVPAGDDTPFVVDLTVVLGDYIGIYYSAGKIDYESTDGAGMWYISGADHIPCTNQLFDFSASVYLSLRGTGAEAGWSGKISGVTNPAKVMGVDVANIAKVKGVA